MAAMNDEVEWYVGRDGQQYGPITTREMDRLVQLGHLRPEDLVWRQGLDAWQPAGIAFMPLSTAQQQSGTPGHSEPQTSTAATAGPDLLASAAEAVRQMRDAAPAPGSGRSMPREPLHDQSRSGGMMGPEPRVAAPAPRGAPHPRLAESGDASRAGAHARDDLSAARPESGRVPGSRGGRDTGTGHGRARTRRAKGRATAALSIALLAGGTAAAFVYRDALIDLITPDAPQSSPPVANQSARAPASPQRSGDASIPAQGAVWNLVKTEFPDWYSERTREADRLRSEKRDAQAVERYLAESLVALRRNHANDALAASPAMLKGIAASFVDNLLHLNRQGVAVCYSFVSHGEASPEVLEATKVPEIRHALDRQLAAVFEAVAEGRKLRLTHLPPRKTDYDMLASELVSRGWSDRDLQIFSDPRALSQASPEIVCRLVREWFSAHLSLPDAGAQVRLLAESLRPVVAG